jgi:hypothetical protein
MAQHDMNDTFITNSNLIAPPIALRLRLTVICSGARNRTNRFINHRSPVDHFLLAMAEFSRDHIARITDF